VKAVGNFTDTRFGKFLNSEMRAPAYYASVAINENRGRLRVLLVEDSLPVRTRMRSLIEESVLVTIIGEASTAASAMMLFREHEPDAVVLDLQLEGSTGYTILEEIKRARADCIAIVLTTFAIPECREKCRELGADFFFEKSKEFERVPETLSALIAQRTRIGSGHDEA